MKYRYCLIQKSVQYSYILWKKKTFKQWWSSIPSILTPLILTEFIEQNQIWRHMTLNMDLLWYFRKNQE
jgi:hypothetical protein